MNDIDRRPNSSSLVWGITLIAIGTLFLLDRMGIASVHGLIETYWPMFIVAVGVSRLFCRRSAWSAFWLIAVGLWLQVTTLHVWGLTFHSSWPLLLIALGGGIVLRSLFDPNYRSRRHFREDRHD